MASVFLYHVVGDLTVGKPELVEFWETETVESAIKAIGESTEGSIPVWKKKAHSDIVENSEMRQQRFVGILNALDIVAFLATTQCLDDQEKAMKTPVSKVIVPNNSLLRHVDPATRLIDALEMMKHGVQQLLVAKSGVWKGFSKRFSVMYNGKWLKSVDSGGSSNNVATGISQPCCSSNTTIRDNFCCLSRENVLRFIIGCLGALAPVPLSSIAILGAISATYDFVDSSVPAIQFIQRLPRDPSAVAVVERTPDREHNKIIGEISACKLWKCDYPAAAWALANLSAGQFVMGVEDNVASRVPSDLCAKPKAIVGGIGDMNDGSPRRPKVFSSRSIGFFSNASSRPRLGLSAGSISRSMYRGRSAPLTCKITSSLAAVLAQMLSHRASQVWVTEEESDDVLVGVVSYLDILSAVTKQPAAFITADIRSHGRMAMAMANETQI